MKIAIKKFMNQLFGALNVLIDSEEIFFVGREVAECLGYSNDRDALKRHVEEEDKILLQWKLCKDSPELMTLLWNKPNDFSNKVLINEAGLYSLILGSDLEGAREFKSWVTHDVLPSIRKNGGYIEGQEDLSKEEQERLMSEIASLADKVAFLQKRRHELIREANKQKEAKKKAKAMSRFYEGDSNYWYEEYQKLQARYEQLYSSVSPRQTKKEKAVVNEPVQSIVMVDGYGFLM